MIKKKKNKRGGVVGHKVSEESKKRMSEAKKGNKNPCKYSFEEIKKTLETAIHKASTEVEIKYYMEDGKPKEDELGNKLVMYEFPKYDFIGEVLVSLGTYHEEMASRIDNYDNDKGDLHKLYEKLKKVMEANCYLNTKRGRINTAVGIVNLKSNHKWTDRQDLTSGDKPMNMSVILNELESNKE